MDCTHFATFLLCSKPVVQQALWARCNPSILFKITLDRGTPPTRIGPPAPPSAGRIHRLRSVMSHGHRGPPAARLSGGTGGNGWRTRRRAAGGRGRQSRRSRDDRDHHGGPTAKVDRSGARTGSRAGRLGKTVGALFP